jgi:alpha,alpha-trehalase
MSHLPPYPDEELRAKLRKYIEETWDTLTRDLSHPRTAAEDIKVEGGESKNPLFYISAKEDREQVIERIRERMAGASRSEPEVLVLPAEPDSITQHGLLYLPGPYVVPGGRFNEFYGWDSYFIQRGLLRSGRTQLAASMVDQALYEVEHYGMVLNANRTYYLTRSHPPFLSRMVKEQYEAGASTEWLARAVALVENYYYYWKVPPHLNQATGLSRYYDLGSGPAPEVEYSERDARGKSHYERVRNHLRGARIHAYDPALFYDREEDVLTPLAYVGDRSMRESGFDPTDRFGPLNLDVIHFAPVCLNTLLHRMELDLSMIHQELGNTNAADTWKERAKETAALVDSYFWNEEHGLYFDFHLREGRQREYPFLTTFWPLWAGLASREQAGRVCANLSLFLCDGGLQTSTRITGEQWDAPFAWAPLQWLAVEGLENYGYTEEARSIARRFTAMVAASFAERGILLEKYDAVQCSDSVEGKIHFGYNTNEPGFGWTNAVMLEFIDRYS